MFELMQLMFVLGLVLPPAAVLVAALFLVPLPSIRRRVSRRTAHA
jgi:hypothetical protein